MKRIPGRFHPGECVREEIEARGWTMKDLARRMDFSLSSVEVLCREQRRVTRVTAQALNRAFGISTEFWLRLQRAYDESEEK